MCSKIAVHRYAQVKRIFTVEFHDDHCSNLLVCVEQAFLTLNYYIRGGQCMPPQRLLGLQIPSSLIICCAAKANGSCTLATCGWMGAISAFYGLKGKALELILIIVCILDLPSHRLYG